MFSPLWVFASVFSSLCYANSPGSKQVLFQSWTHQRWWHSARNGCGGQLTVSLWWVTNFIRNHFLAQLSVVALVFCSFQKPHPLHIILCILVLCTLLPIGWCKWPNPVLTALTNRPIHCSSLPLAEGKNSKRPSDETVSCQNTTNNEMEGGVSWCGIWSCQCWWTQFEWCCLHVGNQIGLLQYYYVKLRRSLDTEVAIKIGPSTCILLCSLRGIQIKIMVQQQPSVQTQCCGQLEQWSIVVRKKCLIPWQHPLQTTLHLRYKKSQGPFVGDLGREQLRLFLVLHSNNVRVGLALSLPSLEIIAALKELYETLGNSMAASAAVLANRLTGGGASSRIGYTFAQGWGMVFTGNTWLQRHCWLELVVPILFVFWAALNWLIINSLLESIDGSIL